jgi:hypothetical protein
MPSGQRQPQAAGFLFCCRTGFNDIKISQIIGNRVKKIVPGKTGLPTRELLKELRYIFILNNNFSNRRDSCYFFTKKTFYF